MKITSIVIILLILFTMVFPSYASSSHHSTSLGEAFEQKLEAALVKAPADNEVCFSPDEECDLKLQKFIETATKSLDIAVYDINLDAVVHAILVQSTKIPVRIVVDRKQSKGKYSAVGLLRKANVQVRFGKQKGLMHDKFTIVDGARLETGSFNYTHHAYTANQENQIYLSTPEVVKRYKDQFEKMWQAAAVD